MATRSTLTMALWKKRVKAELSKIQPDQDTIIGLLEEAIRLRLERSKSGTVLTETKSCKI